MEYNNKNKTHNYNIFIEKNIKKKYIIYKNRLSGLENLIELRELVIT